jgi:uncharacterized protein YdhG (YjbR/CyaY superfamily)
MAAKTNSVRFSDEEQAAMKDHAKELKAAARRKGKVDEEPEVLAKLAEMGEPDRAVGEWLHKIIRAAAPELAPKLWYGMPAYAMDGKIVCHFQPAHKFKTRYATLGFSDQANLDDGTMWPVAYALTGRTAADEATITGLVRNAIAPPNR